MLSTISCVYWPSIFLLWRNVYLDLLPIILFYFFLNIELHELFVFLEINPLSTALFVNILSHSEVCLFVLLMVSFAAQVFLSLIRPKLFIVVLIFIILGGGQRHLAAVYVKDCSAYVSLRII